jgi:hypothetical protein
VEGQIGLEETPDAFIQKMVEVFRDVRRVLREDGTLWLNLGDSYAGSGKGPTGENGIQDAERRQGFDKSDSNRGSQKYNPLGGIVPVGYKAKDLMGIPWRVAFALQADGWYLRSAMPWIKRNCMPESTTDRPTSAIEYIFLMTKSARELNRSSVGCELNPEYVKIIRKRLNVDSQLNTGVVSYHFEKVPG